jgi:glycosyltransferase involved in cell wall biosynthesis
MKVNAVYPSSCGPAPMLKIGLVATSLNCEHIRGMGKYLFEMTAQSHYKNNLSWVFMGNDPRFPLRYPKSIAASSDIFEVRGDRFNFWSQFGVPKRSMRHNVDVLHCAENTLPLWQPRPTVVTIHDTIPWVDPTEPFYYQRVLPLALRRCAHVITISETSRIDILKLWPWLESKISVISHGIDAQYFDDKLQSPNSELATSIGGTPYAVYMGGPMERKRFDWAVKVIADITLTPTLKLVACGFGAAARQAAIATLEPALQGRVIFSPFLADSELLALYKGARAVLYPTLYEGFGFPAVEAQAAGVPVIFSPLGSLTELIGPLASVVPATDLAAWRAALQTACSLSDEARSLLAAKARVWARQFDWSQSFEHHLEVYRRASKQPPP